MKKVLLGAGLIALATSCTQDEFSSLATQKEDVRGISFEMVETPQSRIQWDETETSYSPYWHAEVDRVGIYSIGVHMDYEGTAWNDSADVATPYWKNWATEGNAKAIYKATQSAKAGKFTSVDDDNMLGFNGSKAGSFFAVYPSSLNASVSGKNVEVTNLPVLNEQAQTGLKGQNPAIVGYAAATATAEESYSSVGETVGLSYKFPLAALVMKTVNANTYTKGTTPMFGKLDSINIVAKGYDADKDGIYETGDIKPSRISYTGGTIKVDTVAWASTIVPSTAVADSAKIKLEIGQNWEDDALAMAAILPVKRTGVYTAAKPETFTVTFNFEKISLQSPVTTVYNDFTGFMEFPALDIEDFDYLVTNLSGTNDRTLIVNAGTFAQIISSDNYVIWPAGSTTKIAPTEFSTIVVNNIALTADEDNTLALFKNATSISLEETTALPKETFIASQANSILSLEMPKVTSIDKDFIKAESGYTREFQDLTTLKLASYEFANPDVNKAFFNASTKTELATLDMSGVVNMLPTFGVDRSLTFEGYSALTTVTIKNGMKVSPKGFKNCTALETVNGVVDMINGEEAFAGATATKFTKINVNSTELPLSAFEGCTNLAEVLYNNAQVAPTKVGAKALANTAIAIMDLTNLTAVADSAFAGSALAKPSKNIVVMTIGATEIGKNAFEGTALTMVNFTNATTIADDMLKGTNLKHLKFTKAFTVPEAAPFTVWSSTTFGNCAGVDLFINPNQKYMNGTTMVLPTSATTSQSFSFKTVQKE